ncbi:hypothetical protein [Pseudonocardia sp. HH130630-07]|uniref:hypothetical protein n=1 Tax=Pseudonocardia sp. HH130630-07 TaxID=1690815 RepID=UPI0012EA0D23|nr:hypothetical protein [Pseudonocardia sp. HH130630-07]
MTAEVVEEPDVIAEPVPCSRCSNGAMLTIVGRCADCISDMGRHHPEEREAWKQELTAAIESRGE